MCRMDVCADILYNLDRMTCVLCVWASVLDSLGKDSQSVHYYVVLWFSSVRKSYHSRLCLDPFVRWRI